MWSFVQYKQIGSDVRHERQRWTSQHQMNSTANRRSINLEGSQHSTTRRNEHPEQQTIGRPKGSGNDESGDETEDGKIIVRLNGDDDPLDPHNWPLLKRARAMAILCMLVFTQAWAGACDSLVNSKASQRYHVSPVAEDLSTAMYLFGIGSGCLFVGPLSQTLGRNPVYLGFTLAYLFFILGTALSKDYASRIVCRYLAGLASSATLGINGASMGDMFKPVEQALWFPILAWVNVVRSYNLSTFIDQLLIVHSASPCTHSGRLDCLTRRSELDMDRLDHLDHLRIRLPPRLLFPA